MTRRIFIVGMFVLIAVPAWPCSIVGPRPTPAQLVSRAEAIVRVKAVGLASSPGVPGTMAGSNTQVQFDVLDVLKGDFPEPSIEFNGTLSDRDDYNADLVPRTFVRPGGRGGNCFAMTYRLGAEYLLLLSRGNHQSYAEPHDLTPYWAPLGPTNEQLSDGSRDAWLSWVSRLLSR